MKRPNRYGMLRCGIAAFAIGMTAAAAGAQDVPAGQAPVAAPATGAEAAPMAASPAPAPSPLAIPPQPGMTVASGCFVPPAKLSATDVEAFLERPESIFADFGSSNLSLANRVRALAGSDERTLSPLVRLSNAANTQQVTAIGAGLGRAAVACARVNADYAQAIQKSIVDQPSPEFQTAFITASKDVQVAAIQGGGNGGAAAAGISGGGLAGPGTAGLGRDEVVPTTVDTYKSGGAAIVFDAGSNSSSGGTTNTGNNSPDQVM